MEAPQPPAFSLVPRGTVAPGPPEELELMPAGGGVRERGFRVGRVALRGHAAARGAGRVITCVVETDRGSVEDVYLEGPGGGDALERAGAFLAGSAGMAALVARMLLSLERELDGRGGGPARGRPRSGPPL